jgi:HEAT repeat protein
VSDFRTELEQQVQTDDPANRASLQAAVDAVLAAGVQSRDDLYALLLDPAAGPNRDHACWLLGWMGDDAAVAALVTAFRDPDVAMRRSAVVALGRLAHPDSTPALIEAMQTDADDRTRNIATLALGTICASTAMEPLLAVLANRAELANVRGAAAEALNGYRDPRVVAALVTALEDPEPEVRFFAAFALSAAGDESALPALERLAAADEARVNDFGTVRDEAISAIEAIREAARAPRER